MTPMEIAAAVEDRVLGASVAYLLFAVMVALVVVLLWTEWRHSKAERARRAHVKARLEQLTGHRVTDVRIRRNGFGG
jgi:membrane protein implicated in regulation of membrane protease activity